MEKIIARISKPQGRRLNIYNHELTKRSNQFGPALPIGPNDNKSNSLGDSNKPEMTIESDELNINDEKQEISEQKDTKKESNVFLIEDYAELLIQKLRLLNSNNNNPKLRYYASNDLYNHNK